MPSDRNKASYATSSTPAQSHSKLIEIGLVAAASALAGGLAAAWWHRKTLTKLQNPIVPSNIQKSVEAADDPEDTDFV